MVCRDRSTELYGIVSALRAKPGGQPLPPPGGSRRLGREQRSEFYEFASHVTRELHDTSEMLGKLTKLIRQRNVFEDNQADVQEMSVVVKHKIGMLHSDIQKLQQMGDARRGWNAATQADKHSNTVVNTLRTQLMDTTKVFKDVLQSRTETLKETHTRRANFTAEPTRLSTMMANRAALDEELSRGENGGGMLVPSGGLQTMMDPNGSRTYFAARNDAVRQVERTITELGGMFQEFARVVQEQDELILRIDDDIETALTHVDRGQNELLRTLTRISGNRWLILKIFAVLFFFIVFFGLFILK